MFATGLMVGVFCGAFIGIFIMCAMSVAKSADERSERVRHINGNASIMGGCRLVPSEGTTEEDDAGEKSNAV